MSEQVDYWQARFDSINQEMIDNSNSYASGEVTYEQMMEKYEALMVQIAEAQTNLYQAHTDAVHVAIAEQEKMAADRAREEAEAARLAEQQQQQEREAQQRAQQQAQQAQMQASKSQGGLSNAPRNPYQAPKLPLTTSASQNRMNPYGNPNANAQQPASPRQQQPYGNTGTPNPALNTSNPDLRARGGQPPQQPASPRGYQAKPAQYPARGGPYSPYQQQPYTRGGQPPNQYQQTPPSNQQSPQNPSSGQSTPNQYQQTPPNQYQQTPPNQPQQYQQTPPQQYQNSQPVSPSQAPQSPPFEQQSPSLAELPQSDAGLTNSSSNVPQYQPSQRPFSEPNPNLNRNDSFKHGTPQQQISPRAQDVDLRGFVASSSEPVEEPVTSAKPTSPDQAHFASNPSARRPNAFQSVAPRERNTAQRLQTTRSLQSNDAHEERRSAPSGRANVGGSRVNLGQQQITVDLSPQQPIDPFNARNTNVVNARHKVQEIAIKYDVPSSFSTVRIVERMQLAYANGKITDPNYHEDLKFCQASIEITSPCTSPRPLTDERGKPRSVVGSAHNSNNNSSSSLTATVSTPPLHVSGDTVTPTGMYKPKAIAALKVNVKQHRASQKLTFQPPCKPIPSKLRNQFFSVYDADNFFFGPPGEYTIPLRMSELNSLAENVAVIENKKYAQKTASMPTNAGPILPIGNRVACNADLVIKIKDAVNIASGNTFGGKSDSFVELKLQNKQGKAFTESRQITNVVKDTLNPSWNQIFSFPLENLEYSLLLGVKNADVTSSSVLGKTVLNFSDIRHYNELLTKNLSLQPASGSVNIEYIITSRKDQDDQSRSNGPISSEGNLYIRLIEGKLLKKEGNPFVEITFDGTKTTKKIKSVSNTCNPYWKEEVMFPVDNTLRSKSLVLQVKDDGLRTVKLGFTTVNLAKICDDSVYDRSEPLKEGGDGTIHYALFFQPKIKADASIQMFSRAKQQHWASLLDQYNRRPRCPWDTIQNYATRAGFSADGKFYSSSDWPCSPVTLTVRAFGEISFAKFYRRARTRAAMNIDHSGAHGVDGDPGARGETGTHGTDARSPGQPGNPGGKGKRGKDGKPGTAGKSARNIDCVLSSTGYGFGQAGDIEVAVRCDGNDRVLFGECGYSDTVLVLDSRGGIGGAGGDGGEGGQGGNGGDGAKGVEGTYGNPDGGDGGRGGDGGDGGEGGDGGDGGDSGACGDAGQIVLSSCDPLLLMLYHDSTHLIQGGTPKSPGAAGPGGWGGSGGSGGPGGDGGRGAPYTKVDDQGNTVHCTGWNGSTGSPGSRGDGGGRGDAGRPGRCGSEGRDGSFTFQITSPDGRVLYYSDRRYNVRFVEYTVVDGENNVQDGIFEPNQEIIIQNIVITNSGGLPLPEGAVCRLVASEFILPFGEILAVPSLAVGQSTTLNGVFRARISDFPSPTVSMETLNHTLELYPCSELFGRAFFGSSPVAHVNCRYPVKIASYLNAHAFAHGETAVISIKLQNVSTLAAYSVSPATQLTILFSVESGLTINPSHEPYGSAQNIMQSTFAIERIDPGQTIEFQVVITMNPEVMFFDRKKWRATLILRDRPIAFVEDKVRCAPSWYEYEAAPGRDLIVFAGNSWSLINYMYWEKLAMGLGLNLRVWDYFRYHGISFNKSTAYYYHHGETPECWRNTDDFYNPLMVFCLDGTDFSRALRFKDIVAHFPYQREKSCAFESIVKCNRYDDGVIFCGMRANDLVSRLGVEGATVNLSGQNLYFASGSSSKPSVKDAKKKLKEIVKKLHETDPAHLYTVQGLSIDIIKGEHAEKKWSFGDCRVTQVDIPITSRILCQEFTSSILSTTVPDPVPEKKKRGLFGNKKEKKKEAAEANAADARPRLARTNDRDDCENCGAGRCFNSIVLPDAIETEITYKVTGAKSKSARLVESVQWQQAIAQCILETFPTIKETFTCLDPRGCGCPCCDQAKNDSVKQKKNTAQKIGGASLVALGMVGTVASMGIAAPLTNTMVVGGGAMMKGAGKDKENVKYKESKIQSDYAYQMTSMAAVNKLFGLALREPPKPQTVQGDGADDGEKSEGELDREEQENLDAQLHWRFDEKDLNETDEFFRSDSFPLDGDRFIKMAIQIYFSLSIKHKFKVMLEAAADSLPANSWKLLTPRDTSCTMEDVYCLGLYADIRGDFVAKDDSYPQIECIVSIISSAPDIYCIPLIVTACNYAIKRIEKSTGTFSSTPKKFDEFSKTFSKLLETSMAPETMKTCSKRASEILKNHTESKKEVKEVFKKILKDNYWQDFWCKKFYDAK